MEKLDQAILVIESLNGSGTFGKANQPTRIISKASRLKMARAQRARWARAKNGSQPEIEIAKTTSSAPVKHTIVGFSPQEDRCVPASEMGKNKSSAEEGCIDRFNVSVAVSLRIRVG